MNKILIIIVIILIPITIVTDKQEVAEVMYGSTLENISLEVPIDDDNIEKENEENVGKESTQVLISNNSDKSNPYYIDLEDYIIGVVAGEMPASFNMEALKAQAIASRSFAINKMNTIKNYVLSTNINDQVYLTNEKMKQKWGSDYEYYYRRVKEAVDATKGQVLTFNDNVISAYYFAISNGFTDDAETVFSENKDYLVSVESAWDKSYQSYTSTRTMDKNAFCTKLGITCSTVTISNINRASSNYVREITINNIVFTGVQVFNKLALKSTDFDIKVDGDNVIITTRGFGHGVGMSQYGAQGMAKEGYNYEDILKHYYQNTEISAI